MTFRRPSINYCLKYIVQAKHPITESKISKILFLRCILPALAYPKSRSLSSTSCLFESRDDLAISRCAKTFTRPGIERGPSNKGVRKFGLAVFRPRTVKDPTINPGCPASKTSPLRGLANCSTWRTVSRRPTPRWQNLSRLGLLTKRETAKRGATGARCRSPLDPCLSSFCSFRYPRVLYVVNLVPTAWDPSRDLPADFGRFLSEHLTLSSVWIVKIFVWSRGNGSWWSVAWSLSTMRNKFVPAVGRRLVFRAERIICFRTATMRNQFVPCFEGLFSSYQRHELFLHCKFSDLMVFRLL